MRRLTAAMAVAGLVVTPVIGALAGPGSAFAQSTAPSEAPEGEQSAPEPVPGEEVCTASDPRLAEVSGLVALDDGYIVINDSTDFEDRLPIFFLDASCAVVDQQGFDPGRPRDPEDLALDREANVLWVGDTGDNAASGGEGEVRPTVALWRVELDGDRTPVIHRFTYPDGTARDAEALLLTGDGTPIIVTKAVGSAELFTPTELRPSSGPDDAVPLEAVGEFTPQDTEAEHGLGQVAEQLVTGGANAPDNSAVVLRTYTDAYEFEVTDGDVVAAVTEGEPLVTPLPDEPLGEAISYTGDGARFVTISEVPPDSDFTPVVLSYAPVAPPEPEDAGEAAAPAGGASGGGGGGLFDSVQDIINVIAAVGVIGVVLVAAGIFGIVRARRRAAAGGAGDGPDGGDDGGPVTGRARLTGGPGGDQPQGWGPEQPPGVYTSQAAREPEYGQPGYQGGPEYQGEYGGGEYRGGEYGGGQYQGQDEYGYGADPYRQGYQEPYDQDQTWSNGHQQPQGYQSQGYDSQGYQGNQGYPEQGYPEQGYQGQGYQGQAYQGQAYQGQAYQGQEYQGQAYQGQEYQGQEYQGGYPDQAYAPAQEGGGAYAGGTYGSAPAEDYANDPDYSYEFRQQQQPGRWQ